MHINGPDESPYRQFRREMWAELSDWQRNLVEQFPLRWEADEDPFSALNAQWPIDANGQRPLHIEIADEAQELSRHNFEQDPDYQTRVCTECGMWPKYHTHRGYDCNCSTCDPEGYRWENATASNLPGLGDDFMYGRGSTETFRPHP